MTFDTDETRWRALQCRDASADGCFVYGVRSTRIYCRPTCKARLARQANVSYYQDAADARGAGFRACKRCKPDMDGLMPEEAGMRKIRAYVAWRAGQAPGDLSQPEERASLGQMAKSTGLSKWHFHRVFKKCVGMTPAEYAKMMRRGRTGSSLEGSATPSEEGVSSPTGHSQQLSETLALSWLPDAMPSGHRDTGDAGVSDEGLSATLAAAAAWGEDSSWADLVAWPDADFWSADAQRY